MISFTRFGVLVIDKPTYVSPVTTRVTTSFKANWVVPGRGEVRGWRIAGRQPTACAALPKLA